MGKPRFYNEAPWLLPMLHHQAGVSFITKELMKCECFPLIILGGFTYRISLPVDTAIGLNRNHAGFTELSTCWCNTGAI
jgi:hypothetical protein